MNYNPIKPIALSNSSSNTFISCEHKGLLQYIKKEKPDSDYVRPDYFAFGSAYHYVLEKARHVKLHYNMALLREAVLKEFLNWESDGPKLKAILDAYFDMISGSIYEPIFFETWFENDLARGKIDLIVKTPRGKWYICDTKTSGVSLSPSKETELINDTQMNLYGAFHDIIAKKLGLNPDDWEGILYREIEKPRQRYKLGESFNDFHKRIMEGNGQKYREIVLHRDAMKWDSAYQNFLLTLKRARELQAEFIEGQETTARKIFANCKKFGTPCEYWSRCYGQLYSHSKSEELKTILSYL